MSEERDLREGQMRERSDSVYTGKKRERRGKETDWAGGTKQWWAPLGHTK